MPVLLCTSNIEGQAMTQEDTVREKVKEICANFTRPKKGRGSCAIILTGCVLFFGGMFISFLPIRGTEVLGVILVLGGLSVWILGGIGHGVATAVVEKKRLRKIQAAFAAAFPSGSPQRKTALLRLYELLKGRPAGPTKEGNRVQSLCLLCSNLVTDFVMITGENQNALEEFAAPYPSEDETDAGNPLGLCPTLKPITCSLGTARVTFARRGFVLTARIHPTDCSIGDDVVLRVAGVQDGLLSAFGKGLRGKDTRRVDFQDLANEKWSFEIRYTDVDDLAIWLSNFVLDAEASQDQPLNVLLKDLNARGMTLLQHFHAALIREAILLGWAGPNLVMFRERPIDHPFFKQRCALFDCHHFSFQPGTGSKAGDLGLKLGGLGKVTAMTITDHSGATLQILGSKETIDAILSGARSQQVGSVQEP